MAQKMDTAVPSPIHIQKFLGGVDYPTEKASFVNRPRRMAPMTTS